MTPCPSDRRDYLLAEIRDAVLRANLMKAVWDRGSESVNSQRKDILRYLGHNASLDQLLQAYIYPLVDHQDNQSVSYWTRFNEETLRLYPMTLIPRFKETMIPYPEDNPLKTLVDVFEQIEWRTCGGQQPAAGERLSMVVRLVISTLAAWEREAEPGGGPRAAREVGEQLVPICRAVLESS
jgi:hypothetical protein